MSEFPTDWPEVTAPEDLRVAAEDGTRVVRLMAGIKTRIHPDLFKPAIIAGCSVPGGAPGQAEPHEDVVARLEEAMREILSGGREDQVTKTGEPRFGALKAKVGAFTESQREEAWANVSAGETD